MTGLSVETRVKLQLVSACTVGVALQVWLAKYTRPLEKPSDPIFISIFESFVYSSVIFLFSVLANVEVTLNPRLLHKRYWIWPAICVGSGFAVKILDLRDSSDEKNINLILLVRLLAVALDGLYAWFHSTYVAKKSEGILGQELAIRLAFMALNCAVLGTFFGTNPLSLGSYVLQYMALDKELHLDGSSISEVIFVNYGLACLSSVLYMPFVTLPGVEVVAHLVNGSLWRMVGILSLHGLLFVGLVPGMFVFTTVRMATRYLVK